MIFWLPRRHFSARFGSQKGTVAHIFQKLGHRGGDWPPLPPPCAHHWMQCTSRNDVESRIQAAFSRLAHRVFRNITAKTKKVAVVSTLHITDVETGTLHHQDVKTKALTSNMWQVLPAITSQQQSTILKHPLAHTRLPPVTSAQVNSLQRYEEWRPASTWKPGRTEVEDLDLWCQRVSTDGRLLEVWTMK